MLFKFLPSATRSRQVPQFIIFKPNTSSPIRNQRPDIQQRLLVKFWTRTLSTEGNYRLPLDLIEFKFVRSQGPGGQNVNKVSSACEARLDLKLLRDLPVQVRERLITQQKNRINSKQELVVDSQEDRSQHRNREKCLQKLQEIFDVAFVEPKERIVQVEPPEKTKEKWMEEKRRRKELKASRTKIKDYDKYL
jgi:protein subunit release factor B